MNRIGHDGDGGDVIASMLIARHLGQAEYYLHQGRNPRPFSLIAHMLLPLLNSQPYVTGAVWRPNPPDITHDLCHWRPKFYNPNQTLAQSMANAHALGPLDHSPWLTVEPSPRTLHRVIVCRSPRYHSKYFDWGKVGMHYKDRMIFIGLDDERRRLEHACRRRIEHLRIRDFLEAAEFVAGASLVVSNQTFIAWLAHGTGKPLVLETHERIHDTTIPRDGAHYYAKGIGYLP